MRHPRLLLGAIAAAVTLPAALWVAVAASGATGESPTEPLSAPLASVAVGAGEPTPEPPVPTQSPSSPRPDPLAARETPAPSASPTVPAKASENAIPAASAEPDPSRPPATNPPAPPAASPTTPTAPLAEDRQKARDAAPSDAPHVEVPPTRAPSSTPARTTTKVADGWTPPILQVGAITITQPVLSSGAPVEVTIACTPTGSCTMDGSTLLIEPGADVMVTWSAPRTATHRAWSESTTFRS